MDGLFACPECGSDVEMGGVAPGRQVRCGFCHRLLEVPYLPRAAGPLRRHRRYVRPKWVTWAWAGLILVLVVVVTAGAVEIFRRRSNSIQDRAINELLATSGRHESEGRISEALIDLDAALELADRAGPAWVRRREQERSARAELARRVAGSRLETLCPNPSSTFRLGDWLNLIAWAERDTDLAPLAPRIVEGFQKSLIEEATRELALGRQLFESGKVSSAMDACDRVGALLQHFSKEAEPETRKEAESLANDLVGTAGIGVNVRPGNFVYGSNSYVVALIPVLDRTLEAKGYLPRREKSVWQHAWRHAPFEARLDVDEKQEDRYFSSENRLTVIHIDLLVTQGQREIWRTSPRARSVVPLPGLPAYLATRAAVSPERSDEFERLLYKSARDQIDQKFSTSLASMPQCPVPAQH